MNDNDLASRVLKQLEVEEEKDTICNPDQWGIDDCGFPWPNPVNAQAVAIRVFAKWGKKDGIDNIYKIEDDIFIGRKRVRQDRATLLSLYEKPNIVLWANSNIELQDENEVWSQIKKIIASEWPVVWAIIKDVAPEYSRDYIRITDDMVWGKDESDILIM